MAVVVSRESYFETGLDVLSDLGYGGLKLAAVCHRLGVTSGSFYHYFSNWPAYTRALVSYWLENRTVNLIRSAANERDPRVRIERLINDALALPHSAESAIRIWSALDPDVREAQQAADQQRFEVMRDAAVEILDDERQAHLFAAWCLYLLVGYEQAMIPPAPEDLAWIADQMLAALDERRFDNSRYAG